MLLAPQKKRNLRNQMDNEQIVLEFQFKHKRISEDNLRIQTMSLIMIIPIMIIPSTISSLHLNRLD